MTEKQLASIQAVAMDLWAHYIASVRSRLQPIIEMALPLKRRLENKLTYLRHRVTKAASESIDSKIRCVKYTAGRFQSRRNSRTAIYFQCGCLDMAPSCH